MRDRLIELIAEGRELCERIPCEGCTRNCKGLNDCIAKVQADHLLANGVIVPPCKVGVEVYFAAKERDRIFKGELISFSLDAAHFWFFCRYYCGLSLWHQVEDFGKTVFLSGEEAEQALKEKE